MSALKYGGLLALAASGAALVKKGLEDSSGGGTFEGEWSRSIDVPLFTDDQITFARAPEGRYGPTWENDAPGGWPVNAITSARGEAAPYIEAEARRHNLGPEFVKFNLELSRNESGQRFNLPAIRFEMACGPSGPVTERSQRFCVGQRGDRDSDLVIQGAAGLFQWNSGALRDYLTTDVLEDQRFFQYGPLAFAHEMTPSLQLYIPIKRYAMLWKAAKAAGADDVQANWAVRLWHRRPNQFWARVRERQWGGLRRPAGYRGPRAALA